MIQIVRFKMLYRISGNARALKYLEFCISITTFFVRKSQINVIYRNPFNLKKSAADVYWFHMVRQLNVKEFVVSGLIILGIVNLTSKMKNVAQD